MSVSSYISSLSGKKVAIVYQFSGDKDHDKIWYHRWGMSVMSYYGYGFEQIGIEPVYYDINSFLSLDERKVEQIDYSLNLICGNRDINFWLLVPSISAWYGIQPLPCEGDALLAGERKDIASAFARIIGFNCPEEYRSISDLESGKIYVAKPRDFGSSIGIHIGSSHDILSKYNAGYISDRYIFQEYVQGIDVTIPIIFDFIERKYVFGMAVALVPDDINSDWVFDATQKHSFRHGSIPKNVRRIIYRIPDSVCILIEKLLAMIGKCAMARIDFRVIPAERGSIGESLEFGKYVFIEINPIPTLTQVSGYATGMSEAYTNGVLNSRIIDALHEINVQKDKVINSYVCLSLVGWADYNYIHEK